MPAPWARIGGSQVPKSTDQADGVRDESFQTSEILDRMSEGVVVLGDDLKPLHANRAARDMLGIPHGSLPRRLPSEEMLRLAAAAHREGEEQEGSLRLFFPSSSTLEMRATPLDGHSILVTLRDVTQEMLAQQVRKEFVAHASHELKSPVASMRALAEAVHKALDDDTDAASRFSERLVAESARLGRLVNDLLDLTRLEDAGSTLTETVDLASVARNEMELIEEEASLKKLELSARLTEGTYLRGDTQQLRLLIRNLLENAIRYTPENGHVTIEVDHADGYASVAVADDGIGIAREAQARVFERFYRSDRARSRERGGTGLGLAIVKHVAELHGGSVEVVSNLGQGSKFTARFPRLRPEESPGSLSG